MCRLGKPQARVRVMTEASPTLVLHLYMHRQLAAQVEASILVYSEEKETSTKLGIESNGTHSIATWYSFRDESDPEEGSRRRGPSERHSDMKFVLR